jgi:hypothetical protein
MNNREELAQKVRDIVIAHNGYLRAAIGNHEASAQANEIDLALADFITEQIRLAREDERRTFRKLWDDLGIALGASAGSATGATVKNDFGESWDFQLDRDALNALFKYLNTAQLAPKPEKGQL